MKVTLTAAQKITILNSKDLFGVMQKILLRQDKIRQKKEYFWIVGLERDNTINFVELVGLGSLDWVKIEPREIFRIAVIKNVPKVILVHNHPSGYLKPSEADIMLTNKLKMSGRLLGVKIADHLIISTKSYVSLKELDVM